ncbi:MAG: alpha/beta hydrolase [Deltaproteobacteria bacterium]|nr:alpha/beta hydrolase [Deltaproteobacteria bacterium]
MKTGGSYSKEAFSLTADGHRLRAVLIKPLDRCRSPRTPTLVFLHEGLGSISMWRTFPADLCVATGCPGFVYERWGHGGSGRLAGSLTPRYLHDEAMKSLPEVLERFSGTDVILIGHSDGGTIALIYASVHPGRVRGIITEAAHVFVEDVTVKGIQDAVESYETTGLKEKLAKHHGANTDPMFRRWSDTWLSPEFREWNIEEYLPDITSPLLVIQGEDDQYGTPAQVKAITGQVSGPVKGWLVPDCGHIPHHDARDTVFEEMKRFIIDIRD